MEAEVEQAHRGHGWGEGGPVGPNLVWTQPSLMWVNHGKGSFSFSGFKKGVSQHFEIDQSNLGDLGVR